MFQYDEICVLSNGPVCAQTITLPKNNTPFKLTVTGTSDPADVYFSCFGDLVGPLESGDRIDSPEKHFQLIKPVYDAKAVVVKRSVQQIRPSRSICWNYTLKSSLNVSVAAKLDVDFYGELELKDTKKLAKKHLANGFDPVPSVCSDICDCISRKQALADFNLQEIRDESQFINNLPAIASELSSACRKELNSRYEWGYLSRLNVTINISNLDQILDVLNQEPKIQIERDGKDFDADLELKKLFAEHNFEYKKLLLQALVDIYGRSTLDPTLSQVLITYLQCNPGLSYQEMADAFGTFKTLANAYSPQILLDTVNQITGGRITNGLYLNNRNPG